MRTCPCGFVAPADLDPWDPDWHRQHRDHHLAAYPDLDAGSRGALEQIILHAETRAARGMERTPLESTITEQRIGRASKILGKALTELQRIDPPMADAMASALAAQVELVRASPQLTASETAGSADHWSAGTQLRRANGRR